MFRLVFIALSLFVISQAAKSAEVDPFTKRFVPIEDSLDKLNKKANELLIEAVARANKIEHLCEEKKLYPTLRKYFRNHWLGEFTPWLIKTKEVQKTVVPIQETIYRDFSVFQSLIQGGFARVMRDPTAASLKVNGVYLGTDKFEHFFGSGFSYFNTNYLKGDGIDAALEIGESAEGGFMGALTTGVQAYGDLVANFNGMRFWNHMLAKRNDVLGEEYNRGPYLECQDQKWIIVDHIDFKYYVDQAFDEANNCSKFRTPKMTREVLANLQKLEREDESGRTYQCPMQPETIPSLLKKYGALSDRLLNFEGHLPVRLKSAFGDKWDPK